jgi:hypothetical protein
METLGARVEIALGAGRTACRPILLLDDIHRQRNHGTHIAQGCRQDHGVSRLGKFAKLSQVIIGNA